MPTPKKFSQLPPVASPVVTDRLAGRQVAGNTTSEFALSDLIALFGANMPSNSPLITGWNSLGNAPASVTALGNRSYAVVVNGVDLTGRTSPGMKLMLPRSNTAPTRCTSLNGTTQYYNKTSPAGMTFVDDFAGGIWVKATSYQQGAIMSRYNGTSGWVLRVEATGQISLLGYNGGSSNASYVQSYQSIPLNKWVHVAAQLDMSSFTATTTTSYVMLDGVNAPALVARGGTNPTALIQAGNLEIGSTNGGTLPFAGKIAQAAIYSAKVTQATIRAAANQAMTGSETSLISAYSFDNSLNDLNTTNANNLTAQGSAVATNADTPFTNPVTGTSVVAGTTNFGIIMAQSFSTNTTYTVQIPEGETLPSTGGIGTLYYSTQKTPYGFPGQKAKWDITSLLRTENAVTSNANFGNFISAGWALFVPIGEWNVGYDMELSSTVTVRVTFNLSPTSIVGVAIKSEDLRFSADIQSATSGAGTFIYHTRRIPQSLAAAATYVMYTVGSTTGTVAEGDNSLCQLIAENAYI